MALLSVSVVEVAELRVGGDFETREQTGGDGSEKDLHASDAVEAAVEHIGAWSGRRL